MSINIKYLILLAFCLALFPAAAIGQTEDEQILRLEKEILELKKEKIKRLGDEKRRLEGDTEITFPGAPATAVATFVMPPSPVPSRPVPPPATPALTGNSGALGANPPPLPGKPIVTAADTNCIVNSIDPSEATRVQEAVCRLTNKILDESSNELSPNRVGFQLTTLLAARLAKSETDKAFFLESERKRTDKQVGSAPNSAGTTSLAVKGGMPAVIGWAVEQGAATSSVDGNTVTVRVNPYNLGKSIFYNQGILDLKLNEHKEDAFGAFLRRVSLGFSFDTSRGTGSPIFIGSKQQLSALSFRYEFVNHRNPLSSRYNKDRLAFFDAQKGNQDKVALALNSLIDFQNDKFRSELLNKWVDETNTELNAISANLDPASRRVRVQTIIENRLKGLPTEALSKQEEIESAIKRFTEGSIGFKTARDELVESFNKGTVATFEYTNNREVNAPDTSNFRFIYEKGVFRNVDFTFNAAVTIYNKKPLTAGINRLKDFDFTAQVDVPFKNTLLGETFLSFAGKYVRQPGEVTLPNGVVANGSKGDIAFGQVKFTIPIRDTGIRLPLSLTFANRTEFIRENNISAGFGFTFDLDPLLAKFKPF